MDILLTHGYFLTEDPLERKVMKPYPPLGLLYISSYLKSKEFNVEVLDTTFMSYGAASNFIADKRPAIVGIYCNMMTKFNVLKLIELCRSLNSTIILGGPEPVNYIEEYIAYGADIIVLGEGEEALAELVPRLQTNGRQELWKISGIAFRADDGTVQKTQPRVLQPKLDELPFPDRDAIDMSAYLRTWKEHHHQSSVSLITARGCPYTCTWCSHSVFGFSHRRRSVPNVVDEVEQIIARYNPDMLWYADDVFTIHTRWFLDYADELERRNIRIPFECISREDRLDEDIIRRLAEIGCARLWIGSESGSQRILDAMQRKTDAVRVREMTKLLQKYGIEAGMFIMLGYEGETLTDLKQTVLHLKAANPDIFLTTVSYPIKGTKYYEQIDGKVMRPADWANHTDRDLDVAGRRSRRYYEFVNRWMVNEVNFSRRLRNGGVDLVGAARVKLSAQVGRLGMAVVGKRGLVRK